MYTSIPRKNRKYLKKGGSTCEVVGIGLSGFMELGVLFNTHVCAVQPALLDLRLYKSTPLCYTSALSHTSTPSGSLYRQLLEEEKKKIVLTSLKSGWIFADGHRGLLHNRPPLIMERRSTRITDIRNSKDHQQPLIVVLRPQSRERLTRSLSRCT